MTTQWIPSPSTFAARTDVGTARDHNEDRHLARPPIFAVADGLGGHSAGEVAAGILVDSLSRLTEASAGDDLVRAIEAADREIYDVSRQDAGRRGMSTTCVALLLGNGAAQVSHVGDSRAYRLRGGVLSRLTQDHSVVAELVRNRIISEADAEVDDRRHMLTQALGSDRPATVTTTPLEVQAGDRFLLCSDGLSGQVSDAAVEAILVEHGDPGLAADALVQRANEAGGIDNVTVIVVDAQASAVSSARPVAPAASGTKTSSAPAGALRRPRRRAASILLVLLAVVLLGGVAAWAAMTISNTPDGTPSPAPPSGSAPPVGSFVVSPSDNVVPPPARSAPPGSAAPSTSTAPLASTPPASTAP